VFPGWDGWQDTICVAMAVAATACVSFILLLLLVDCIVVPYFADGRFTGLFRFIHNVHGPRPSTLKNFGNEPEQVVLAALGKTHEVPYPAGVAFPAQTRYVHFRSSHGIDKVSRKIFRHADWFRSFTLRDVCKIYFWLVYGFGVLTKQKKDMYS
jgi:hypothetical protein